MNKYQRAQMKKSWRVFCHVNGCTNITKIIIANGKNRSAARKEAINNLVKIGYKTVEITLVLEEW